MRRRADRRQGQVTLTMLGLVFSLSLMLALTHLSAPTPTTYFGVDRVRKAEQVLLDEMDFVAIMPAPERKPEKPAAPESRLPGDVRLAEAVSDDVVEAREFEAAGAEAMGWANETGGMLMPRAPAPVHTVASVRLQQGVVELPVPVGDVPGVEEPPALLMDTFDLRYPAKARRRQVEGLVVLAILVETDGRPRDVRVLQSLHPLCDDASVRAIRSARFRPGRRNAQNVPTVMRLGIRFELFDI